MKKKMQYSVQKYGKNWKFKNDLKGLLQDLNMELSFFSQTLILAINKNTIEKVNIMKNFNRKKIQIK